MSNYTAYTKEEVERILNPPKKKRTFSFASAFLSMIVAFSTIGITLYGSYMLQLVIEYYFK